MKMTLVIDTDDSNGIKDSFKIIKMMDEKYNGRHREYNDRAFGKIRFIKLLRAYGRSTADQEADAATLRCAKHFADAVWRGDHD